MGKYSKTETKLKELQRQLKEFREKVKKGEIGGNGVPEMERDLQNEITLLKATLGIDEDPNELK